MNIYSLEAVLHLPDLDNFSRVRILKDDFFYNNTLLTILRQ